MDHQNMTSITPLPLFHLRKMPLLVYPMDPELRLRELEESLAQQKDTTSAVQGMLDDPRAPRSNQLWKHQTPVN